MRVLLCATLLVALAAAGSPALNAQEIQGLGGACKADREKFCPGVKPGDGKFGSCMKEHAGELSPQCSEALQAAKEARDKIKSACKADAGKFCADVSKGHGQVIKCLEGHASELEQPCADALKSRPAAKKA